MSVLSKGGRIISSSGKVINYNSIPRNGLVGEWILRNNALDTSGNNFHGTVTGATLDVGRKGVSNSCYLFNTTTETIDCGDNLDIGLSDMSISAWYKMISPATVNPVVGKAATNSEFGNYLLGKDFTSNKMRMVFTYAANNNVIILSNENINTYWNHYAINIDRDGNLTMYINGRIQDDVKSIAAHSAINMDSIRNLQIGNAYGNYTANGYISEVRIYNRVLTLNEIYNLCNE